MPNNILKQKKAQTRMLETIAVILIFFMLVAFGFVFYANMQKSNTETKYMEEKNAKAIKIAKSALNLPELQCNGKTYCFDESKITAFSSGSVPKNQYFEVFRYSEITLEKIYPSKGKVQVYSRKNPATTSKQSIWVPVALNDPLTGTSFAILTVDAYE
ncbi:hypothetical protein HYU11_00830 [Candidatus Woesearchaeota archaeon]|nr:hypothetical protein [Candidatus Woesearchaeota archaeon]